MRSNIFSGVLWMGAALTLDSFALSPAAVFRSVFHVHWPEFRWPCWLPREYVKELLERYSCRRKVLDCTLRAKSRDRLWLKPLAAISFSCRRRYV